MLFKKKQREILKAQLNLIHLQIVDVHEKMIKTLLHISRLFGNRQIHEARGYLVGIHDLSDLLKKQITTYITQSIFPIFETKANLSYSLEEIKGKKDRVFEWLSEVIQETKKFRKSLKTAKDPEEILGGFDKLLEKAGYDDRFTDFVDTLYVIVQEFEMYRSQKPMDKLAFVFDNLKLHSTIKKASGELFKDGHYASAIFEAYKALNNYVKRRSGRKKLDGKDLMAKVFGCAYNQEADQIERKPILQLNELRNRSERNEQKGFMFLFMGAMQGIRNPKAHDLVEQKDPYIDITVSFGCQSLSKESR